MLWKLARTYINTEPFEATRQLRWPKEHNQGIVRAGEKERQYRDGKRRQRSITKSERDVPAAPKLGWLMG
jgi:hypothetical protein